MLSLFIALDFLRLTLCCSTKAEKVILERRPTSMKITDYRKQIAEPPGGSGDDAVVRALASLHCGPGSHPGPEVTCTGGLSLLLVLVLTTRIFSGSPSSFHKNQHSKFQFDLETVDKNNSANFDDLFDSRYRISHLARFY